MIRHLQILGLLLVPLLLVLPPHPTTPSTPDERQDQPRSILYNDGVAPPLGAVAPAKPGWYAEALGGAIRRPRRPQPTPIPTAPVGSTATPTPPKTRPTATPAPTQTPTATPTQTPTGTSYYVAPNGNDANPGTLAAPFAEVQTGLVRLTPGDTLYLRGGTYFPSTSLWIVQQGTAARPITVRNYPGETPVIDGRGRVDHHVLVTENSAWLVLAGLTVQNAGGVYGNGISLFNTVDSVLRDITVRGAPQDAISIGPTSSRITVLNCDLSDAATGLEIQGHDVLIDGCKSHDNGRMLWDGFDCDDDPATGGDHGGQAFAVNGTNGPVEIRNSEGWNNTTPSICYGRDGAFVELFRSQNVNIHHNRSRDGVVTLEASGDTSGIRFWRNQVSNEWFLTAHQANGLTIANNTIWNTKPDVWTMVWIGGGTAFGNGGTAGLVFVNNIVSTPGRFFWIGRPLDPTATIDTNLYHAPGTPAAVEFARLNGSSYAAFAGWQAADGRERGSLATDPLLLNGAAADFRLQATSPAIDRGAPVAGVTSRFTGSAPDVGAWEYGGTGGQSVP